MESKFNIDYVKKGISNGVINLRILKKFFYDMKLFSYDYGYKIQDELVDLKNFIIYSTGKEISNSRIELECFTDDKYHRVLEYSIDTEIVYALRRREYRQNKLLFDKFLSYDDIQNNFRIFKYTPLVFVDNKVNTDIRLKPDEDKTKIYFKYSKFATNNVCNENSVIDVLMLTKSLIDTITLSNGNIDIGQKTISASLFKYNNQFKRYTKYIGFIYSDTANIFIGDITYDAVSNTFNLGKSTIPSNYNGMKFTLVALGNFLKQLDFIATDKYFELTGTGMPIPKNNMLIMIRDKDGINYYPNDGSISITEYYPNIYEISNPKGLVFSIYVLYDETESSGNIYYDNELSYYLSKINLLNSYQLDTTPDILREYKPVKWDYLLKTFFDTYGDNWVTEENDKFNSLQYKLDTIAKYYKKWAMFLDVFIKQTYGFLSGYLMDCSKIDLSNRVRTDTTKEFDQFSLIHETFDEPQIVFAYKNDLYPSIETSYLFYIDGCMVNPTFQAPYLDYHYVYIPQSKIKAKSIIEIERFDGLRFTHPVDISDEPVTISMDFLPCDILANMLFFSDANTGEYLNLNMEDYKLTFCDEFGNFDMIDKNSVYIIRKDTKIIITPLRDEAKHRTLRIHCNNKLVVFQQPQDIANGLHDANQKGYINGTMHDIRPRFRMYTSDGRRISNTLILDGTISTPDTVSQPVITPYVGEDDPYYVYTGYDERLVYSLDMIPENGLIDFQGKLKRPFSLTYYNVYINGYRMTRFNLETISPFVVAFKNISTRYNLEIYEKVRPEDCIFEFEIDEDSSYIQDNVYDNDSDYRDKINTELPVIVVDPDIPNIDDIVSTPMRELAKWIVENGIDADERYEMREELQQFFDPDSHRFLVDPDLRISENVPEEQWVYLEPDKRIK